MSTKVKALSEIGVGENKRQGQTKIERWKRRILLLGALADWGITAIDEDYAYRDY